MKLTIGFLLAFVGNQGGAHAATCGNGNRGDGICANGQCCSQWGWCGSTPEHCSGPSPTPPTSTTLKGDWQLCSKSSECANGCCSGQYSGGTLKCTPLNGGYNSNICVGGSTNPPPAPTPTPPTSPTSGLKGDWQLCSRSSECANGCCSGQYSGGTLKCTPLNGGYNSNTCVGGSPTSPTQPSPTPPTSGGSRAYVTYHNYFAGEPLTDVACSDGRNGLMTRWGYSTIDPMAPYVAATSISGWNSPNCGKCYQVNGSAKTIYLTAIDQCAPGPANEMHFDIHPEAYKELMGDKGVFDGSGYVTYKEVASSNCRGNKG